MTDPSVSPAPLDPEQVRAAVLACAGVAGVPGRGPNGVAVARNEVEVHVVARYGISFEELGRTVDDALAPLLDGRRLQITVDDVEDPAAVAPRDTPTSGSSA